MPKITVIPQTRDALTRIPINTMVKRKVAGYARVSTDLEEQITSYEAQVDYYTKYIKSNPNWEFVDVYTDEGISATSTKKRYGFNQMIADALAGKIDLIVTKSVSRFARNTVDSLDTIRKLKAKGVECYFEKENIYTFDGKGELVLTIMASLAQEESRSISENVTWGKRKAFSDGKVGLPYKAFLGYRKGEDGNLEIIEEEAVIVRLIYSLYLEGLTINGICDRLTELGYVPKLKKTKKWHPTTINSILHNEKYKGDALLQKNYTVDFLTKTRKKNNGEVQQYYVENHHPAIISKDEWDDVRAEELRRQAYNGAYSSKGIFGAKVMCAECGGIFGLKTWHSNDSYKRVVLQCNNKYKSKESHCTNTHLSVEELQEMFFKAYNIYMSGAEQVIKDINFLIEKLTDFTNLDLEISKTNDELEVIRNMVEKLVKDNSTIAMSQEEYQRKYNSLYDKYEEVETRYNELVDKKTKAINRNNYLKRYIKILKKNPTNLVQWDSGIWALVIEKALVHKDKSVTFKFICGKEIRIEY